MPYPGRNNIYDATIKRMVNEALDAQEQEFAQNRGGDSDEQLLAYKAYENLLTRLCYVPEYVLRYPRAPGVG